MSSIIKLVNINSVNYYDYENDLKSDGMLRDLWVFDSILTDWQSVLDALAKVYKFKYMEDGKDVSVLPSAKEIHAIRENKRPSISFEIGIMIANSFFVCTEEIDFDFGHKDILPETFPDLVKFMSLICRSVNKQVALTHEGNRDDIIIAVTP